MSGLPVQFVGALSLVEGRAQLDGEIGVHVLWRAASYTGITLIAAIVGRSAAATMLSAVRGILVGVTAWVVVVGLQLLFVKAEQRKLASEIKALVDRVG